MMSFKPGFNIKPLFSPLGFEYGEDCFGPEVELRSLASIRPSLLDPTCKGPDPVYAIAMDVGKSIHKPFLEINNLLFGAVVYACGTLGNEPVRSQGHVHKKVRNNRLAPPEIYEIWSGTAIIYMQEADTDDPGRCFAVEATTGEVVVVPPGWAHATISASKDEPLAFGAWCDRHYSFEYAGVRAHGGLAWFPVWQQGNIEWIANRKYKPSELIQKKPGPVHRLGIKKGVPVYTIFEQDPESFLYVTQPEKKNEVWEDFEP